jgi:SAM-dependent methyltransferase
MKIDIRTEAAKFYDFNPEPPDDIPFYLDLIPSPQASILELGCGTGRVTLALVPHCQYIHGIDLSSAMIALCEEKLAKANIPQTKAHVEVGDITAFELGRSFDLIIAPFRVMQNLETDEEVDGLFECIHRHLAPNGTAILNVFRPFYTPETLPQRWISLEENPNWEVLIEGGRITCHDLRPRVDAEKLVLYPELIYRRYIGDELQEEAVLKIIMRCYYPEQFEKLIESHGFAVQNRWGGYAGEVYGEGPELVIQFEERSDK